VAEDPVVFAPGMEGLIRAVAPRATAATWDAMRAVGFDHARRLRSDYPVRVWLDCLDIAVRTCHPELPRAEALERLGHAAIAGFRETVVGMATFQFLRIVGIRRALAQLSWNFRGGNNFTRFSVKAPRFGRAEIEATGMFGVAPHFLGMLVAGALGSGAKGATGTMLEDRGETARFVLAWNER
jgi:uncharacterized protein (TIGR02265 family)